MDKLIDRIVLDCCDTRPSQAIVYAKKGEADSRRIVILLKQGRTPYIIPEGATAVIYAKKPDGTVLYNTCEVRNEAVFYDITTQTVAAVGNVECEVQIIGTDGAVLYSPSFTLVAEGRISDEGASESTNEYTFIEELVKQCVEENLPTDLDVANKKYVDDAIAAAVGNAIGGSY